MGQEAARLQSCAELLGHVSPNLDAQAIAGLFGAAPAGLPPVVGFSGSPVLERAALISAGLLNIGHIDDSDRLLALVFRSDSLTRAAILTRAGRFEEAIGQLTGRNEAGGSAALPKRWPSKVAGTSTLPGRARRP